MEVNVFIVDDEQRAIDGLSNVLNSFFDNVTIVGSASTVSEAYEGITATRPELIFLDIEMGKESGFQLLERFKHIDFHVAFLTAHEEFALKAIKFSALDYIIKPAEVEELERLIKKVREFPGRNQADIRVKHMIGNFSTSEKKEHKITIAVSDGYEFVQIREILYLLADGSYTRFFLRSGDFITTSRNLGYFESLLDGYGFFRIHNSTLINLSYIKKISRTAGGSVLMENNREFGISKRRKEEFMQLLSLR